MWCLAVRPSHSRAARRVTRPRVAAEARLMLVSPRACRDGAEAAAPSCGPPGAGRRRHRCERLSGDPPGGLLGHPQRGCRGRQLLGLRHRDGWQELLSGTTSMVSRARLGGCATWAWRGWPRTYGSSLSILRAGRVRIGSLHSVVPLARGDDRICRGERQRLPFVATGGAPDGVRARPRQARPA